MTHKPSRRYGVWGALTLLTVAAALLAVPQTRWRIHLIGLHLAGRIPDIQLQELIIFMLPGSDQSVTALITKRNPYAVFENVRTSDEDIASGAALYQQHCVACHGPAAEKKFDATLADADLFQIVLKGKKAEKPPNMPGYEEKGITEDQAKALLAYMKSIKK